MVRNQDHPIIMIHHILIYKSNCGLLEERSGLNIREDAWLNLIPFFTWFIVITRPWFNNTFFAEEIGLATREVTSSMDSL